jgi:ABC-2 type transport system permease protein
MNLRRTLTVARKEYLHILRDTRSLGMALAVPLLLLLMFGYALTLDVDRIPTLIYDADQSPESRELIARFQGSRYFDVLGAVSNYGTSQREIDRDHCLLGVVVDQDYSRDLHNGREAQVQLLLDGSDSNTASLAMGYAATIVQSQNQQVRFRAQNQRGLGRFESPLDGRLRVWYNSELESKNYIVPGLIAVILMIIAALLTSLTIAREWETGTMEQLLSTPLRAAEVVLGKMLAFFCLGLIDMLIALLVGVYVFRVPLRGSVLFLIATSCIFLVGALFWGVLISAVTRSQLVAYQVGMLTSFLPAFLLSGFIFAIESMPEVIQVITFIFPARYFVTILKGIFLRGVGLEMLLGQVAMLLIYGVLVFLIATRKLKQKIA